MQNNIFEISFDHDETHYTGWVDPSDSLNDHGKPVSFHVVLNGVSFGYLFYHGNSWQVSERRPYSLVECVGAAIERYYSSLEDGHD